ncbi:MAG: hypothetical protein WD646_11710 [Actinomycetota bacterium]
MRRTLIEARRYWFDTAAGVVSIYGFFVIIFLGAKLFGGNTPGFGDTLSGVVVSYALWALVIFSLGAVTFELIQEAQLGTLEQLGMSAFGLPRVLVARALTGLVVQVTIVAGLLTVMMATTGRWLNIDLVSIVPLLAVTLLGIIGFGFVLGGLAIVFKRVQQPLQIFQVVVIALVIAPVGTWTWVKFMPLAWGAHLIKQVMVDENRIFDMVGTDLLFLLAHSFVYFTGGLAVFKYFEHTARDRALLGHY